MIKQAYINGFINKCYQLGIGHQDVVKRAAVTSWYLANGGKPYIDARDVADQEPQGKYIYNPKATVMGVPPMITGISGLAGGAAKSLSALRGISGSARAAKAAKPIVHTIPRVLEYERAAEGAASSVSAADSLPLFDKALRAAGLTAAAVLMPHSDSKGDSSTDSGKNHKTTARRRTPLLFTR